MDTISAGIVDSPDSEIGTDEQMAVTTVMRLFDESKRLREEVAERMRKNEQLYNNQPPKNINTEADVKHALAHSAIETVMPILGDYYPTINPKGKQSNDFLFQDYMRRRMTALLEESDFRDKGLSQSKDSLIYRNGYIKIVPMFDYVKDAPENVADMPEEEQINYKTLAGLDVQTVDPFSIYPDPVGTGLDIGKNCRYFIVAEPMTKAEIASKYDISEDTIPDSAFQWSDYRSNVEDKYSTLKDMSTEGFTLLITCYWMSDPKEYPYGRKTVICENKLLEDKKLEIPYTPYFVQKNYKSDRRFYGFGEPELTAATIFAVNSSTSHIIDNLSSFGKPIEVMTPDVYQRLQENSQEDNHKVVTDDPVGGYQLRTYEPVPPSIFRYIETMMGLYDKSSGINDTLEGRRPAGITSARGIEALREASMIRVRFKIKHDITPMLKQIGKYVTYLIAKYDVEESEVRIENPDESGERYLRLNPRAIYSKETKQIIAPEQAKNIKATEYISLQDTEMDITVEIGRGTEKGSVARELQAAERYEQGLIPIEWYINEMQIENKQELIKFHKQKNAVLQLVMRLKDAADSLKNEGVKPAREWIESKEFKAITEAVLALQNMDIDAIAGTRF